MNMTFKEYLIETSETFDENLAQDDREMVRQGTEQGYENRMGGNKKRSNKRLRQMANRYDRSMEGLPPAPYNKKPSEEEEETNAPAFRDRSIEFDNDVKSRTKPTLKDDLKSSPGIKRSKQRYNRFKRRSFGEQ